jgi:hypothetical protein
MARTFESWAGDALVTSRKAWKSTDMRVGLVQAVAAPRFSISEGQRVQLAAEALEPA